MHKSTPAHARPARQAKFQTPLGAQVNLARTSGNPHRETWGDSETFEVARAVPVGLRSAWKQLGGEMAPKMQVYGKVGCLIWRKSGKFVLVLNSKPLCLLYLQPCLGYEVNGAGNDMSDSQHGQGYLGRHRTNVANAAKCREPAANGVPISSCLRSSENLGTSSSFSGLRTGLIPVKNFDLLLIQSWQKTMANGPMWQTWLNVVNGMGFAYAKPEGRREGIPGAVSIAFQLRMFKIFRILVAKIAGC
ncbi:hypothetical protein C8R43DRAFT_1107727 [Mycena crocata]|nr:hypothetical protein C8R43DRAFT_1107727 [Mycena crocata]